MKQVWITAKGAPETLQLRQAPDPQASVIPVPRSHTRRRMRQGEIRLANSTFVRWGKSASFSSQGSAAGNTTI